MKDSLTIGPTSLASFGSGSTGGTTTGCSGFITPKDLAAALPPPASVALATSTGGRER